MGWLRDQTKPPFRRGWRVNRFLQSVMYIMFDYVNAGFQLSSRKHENIKGEKLEPVLGPGNQEGEGTLGLHKLRKNAPEERKETAWDLIWVCVCDVRRRLPGKRV